MIWWGMPAFWECICKLHNMKKLLQLLKKVGYPVYESKLREKFGLKKAFFDQTETDGFIKRVDRGHSLYKGIKITQAGLDELARLEAIVPSPRPKTAEDIRVEELKSKLEDDTITFEELKELIKVMFVQRFIR